MARSLTAQDRSSLIRLASSLPVGSPQRKAILAGLVQAAQNPTWKKIDQELAKAVKNHSKKDVLDEYLDMRGMNPADLAKNIKSGNAVEDLIEYLGTSFESTNNNFDELLTEVENESNFEKDLLKAQENAAKILGQNWLKFLAKM
jgi:hypothetical protein